MLVQHIVQVSRKKVFGVQIAERLVEVDSLDEFGGRDGCRTECVIYLLGNAFFVGGFGNTAEERFLRPDIRST